MDCPDRTADELPTAVATDDLKAQAEVARRLLPSPLRALAQQLAPEELLLDCGGGGRCLWNSLAFLLSCLGLFVGDGDALRAAVIAHATILADEDLPCFKLGSGQGDDLSVRDYLTASLLSWPPAARRGYPAAYTTWLQMMANPVCWGDEAAIAMTADFASVEVEYLAVGAQGTPLSGGVIGPRHGRAARARLVVGLWVQQHYVAVLRASVNPLSRASLRGGDDKGSNNAHLVPTAAQLELFAAFHGATFTPELANSSSPALCICDVGPQSSSNTQERLQTQVCAYAMPGSSDAELTASADHARDTELSADQFNAGSVDAPTPLAEWTLMQMTRGKPFPVSDARWCEVTASGTASGYYDNDRENAARVAALSAELAAGVDPSSLQVCDGHFACTDAGPESPPAKAVQWAAPLSTVRAFEADDSSNKLEWAAPVFDFPLTTAAAVRRLLRSPDAPTVLVAMEFSGALRDALQTIGVKAISADLRSCDAGGMHFKGDVREIVAITQWAAIFFFPNCYQQLRADVDCLPLKLHDGRAFWGCALVLWCLCCATADIVVVEQADTIVYDFLVPEEVMVHEFRTSTLGDQSDKFVRLAVRGLDPAPLDGRAAQLCRKRRRPQPERSQFQYANAEARDRDRSTWRHHPRTCGVVARLLLREHRPPILLEYTEVILRFARAWDAVGYAVPVGFDCGDGQPPTEEGRRYQLERGAGHGQGVARAEFADAQLRAGLLLREGSECGDAGTAADGLSEDEWFVDDGTAYTEPTTPTGLASTEQPVCDPSPTEMERMPTLDVRQATSAAAVLLFVCVIGMPLVYAHLDGFTVIGFELRAREAQPTAMKAIQRMVDAVASCVCYAFMVGEYLRGARLFTAPVAETPQPDRVIRTPHQRQLALAAGVGMAWCSLSALHGTAVEDAVARSFLASTAFLRPTHHLADDPLSSGSTSSSFRFGVQPAAHLVTRPEFAGERGPAAVTALQLMREWDELLIGALDSLSDDPLLAGWREQIVPLGGEHIPPNVLDHLPSFEDPTLDEVALAPVATPVFTPWVALPPQQPSAEGHCPRSVVDLMPEETQLRVYTWLQHDLEDLVRIRDSLAKGTPPGDVFRDRPLALAVGQSELHEWARGITWDCRPALRSAEACCQPLDFHAPFETHLELTVFKHTGSSSTPIRRSSRTFWRECGSMQMWSFRRS